MANTNDMLEMTLVINAANVDDEQLDTMTLRLRNELKELDIESVERVRDDNAPAGSKSGIDPVTINAIAVGVSVAIAPKLIEFLQAWKLRGQGRTIKIKTKEGTDVEFPADISPEEVKKWMKAVTGK